LGAIEERPSPWFQIQYLKKGKKNKEKKKQYSEKGKRKGKKIKPAVKGIKRSESGGLSAADKIFAKVAFGTLYLSAAMSRPPSAIWKDP